MTYETLATLSILGLGSLCMAFSLLSIMAWFGGRSLKAETLALRESDEEIIFLFAGEILVNATQSAHNILSSVAEEADWTGLKNALSSQFPTLQDSITRLEALGEIEMESQDKSSVLRAQWRDGHVRILLSDTEVAQSHVNMDRYSLDAMSKELELLRSASQHVPFLVWRTRRDGSVIWANDTYLTLTNAQSESKASRGEIRADLFDVSLLFSTTAGDFKRLPLLGANGSDRFYEVFPVPLGEETLYTAVPADRTVRAEIALREFMQTLTKTFAHLTIGLAIFDKNRNLVLFNPALTDLTALPVDFLTVRPALTSFLDQLRNQNMMPEPKDYKTWRQEVSELDTAAQAGTYEEVWSLAGGITYKVSGRPHADGAIAFLFEDISAEMSLTRQFRAEIETNQAVFDTLDEAIAVFSGDGSLLASNASYAALWGTDEVEFFDVSSIDDARKTWAHKCAPSPIWEEVKDFVERPENRENWHSAVRLWDGRNLRCRMVALPGGKTLAGFFPEAPTSIGLTNWIPQAALQSAKL